MRRQFELSDDLAAGLAGQHDAMLRALEQRLDTRVYLRGNLLTFDGEESETSAGERETVDVTLVAPVALSDRILVHAGTAIAAAGGIAA